jgi:hypothetical protein
MVMSYLYFPFIRGGRFMLRHYWIVGLTEYSFNRFVATLKHFSLPSSVSQLIIYSAILYKILVSFFRDGKHSHWPLPSSERHTNSKPTQENKHKHKENSIIH